MQSESIPWHRKGGISCAHPQGLPTKLADASGQNGEHPGDGAFALSSQPTAIILQLDFNLLDPGPSFSGCPAQKPNAGLTHLKHGVEGGNQARHLIGAGVMRGT